LHARGAALRGPGGSTEMLECRAMRDGAPWREHGDLHAVAATVHALLHGEYLAIARSPDGTAAPAAPLRRYWQVPVWEDLFSTLLNPPGDAAGVARALRGRLASYFDARPAKRAAVAVALAKQALLVHQFHQAK
jgi:checkpoint serine/threonine-protein kinase